jgi:8-oxo-dGTP diphosphatase
MTKRDTASKLKLPIRRQVSAGGVVLRGRGANAEVVLIMPRGTQRWQLPKGLVDPDEAPAGAARREVREEAGVDAEVVSPLETIEYWYVGTDRDGARVRFHKSVHFFLLEYRGGDVGEHDHEVTEARWVPLVDAVRLLAFPNERAVVEKARGIVAGSG